MSQPLENQSAKNDPLDQHPLNEPEPAFGWTGYAEQINGRFAMIGFVALMLLEFLTQQDLLSWLGLR